MTNEDKYIRDILANGIEEPSGAFTKNVMKQLDKQQIRQEQRVELPSLVIVMAVFFPILALLVSLKPIYSQIDVVLKALNIDSVVNQQTIIVVSLGILVFSLLDIVLLKWFVRNEHYKAMKSLKLLSF